MLSLKPIYVEILAGMSAIILDTETHTLNGLPIEIAYAPVEIRDAKLNLDKSQLFDQYYQVGEPISYAAMAVHHILESDLTDCPMYSQFKLPENTEYIIGHNIDYDLQTIAKCGVDVSQIKAICTLALARQVWPEASAHNISALTYQISRGSHKARELLKGAHRASADIMLTANILVHILYALGLNSLDELYAASEQARIPTKIGFGKHKGSAIQELPADYIQWLLRQDSLDPYLKIALEKSLLNHS